MNYYQSYIKIDNKLFEKINYLEKNHKGIIERYLSISDCSNYEKIKKDCGVKISVLDKLIELGKQYRDLSQDEIFEDKVYEILDPLDPNYKRDVIIEMSVQKENKESENFLHKLYEMYKNYVRKKNGNIFQSLMNYQKRVY